jgi:hypothetical protein
MLASRFPLMCFASAILFLTPNLAHCQNIPANCWRDETCRTANFTSDEWYFGFVQDAVKRKQNVTESRGMLEQSARGRMVESVRINIGSHSQTNTDYSSVSDIENMNFVRTTQTFADAEVINAFIDSYHDTKTNRIYAFAAVRKSDLADFYAAKIEFALNEAKLYIERSKQDLELDKRKEAREKLSDGKKLIDSTADNYRTLLITVDAQNGIKRSQSERVNELLKEIASVLADIEASDIMTVFLDGEENIVVAGLQTLLSDNDIIITEKEEEASFILKTEANICNQTSEGGFHFAYACVKMTLTNAKTGRNEFTVNVTGQKQGGLSAQKAGEKALKSVIPDIWAKIENKVMENIKKQ